jgi:predicted dehydrogenase
LDEGGFDAAVICTPAHTHIPISAQCVERGLHLLIEKPLAVSVEGVEALQNLICERGVVVRVAYVHRSLLVVRKLKELLDSGIIGEPKQYTMVSGQNFPTFRPAYRTIYYARHEAGGGAIQDALTHSLHGSEWLLGPIQRVFSDAAHQVLEGVEVEDTVNLTARLGSGGKVMASFSINQFQAPNENVTNINGTLGSLRAELHHARVGVYLHGSDQWQWHDLPKEDRDGPFLRQAESFLCAISGGVDDMATFAEGLQTLRVNIAALQSSRTRTEVIL